MKLFELDVVNKIVIAVTRCHLKFALSEAVFSYH
jgi:hypothetical protein